jgi:hypothetical protein
MGPLMGNAEILVVVSVGYIAMATELSYRASSWVDTLLPVGDSESLLVVVYAKWE